MWRHWWLHISVSDPAETKILINPVCAAVSRTLHSSNVHLLNGVVDESLPYRLGRRRPPRQNQDARHWPVQTMHRMQLAELLLRSFHSADDRVLAVLARDMHGCARRLVHNHKVRSDGENVDNVRRDWRLMEGQSDARTGQASGRSWTHREPSTRRRPSEHACS
jgi:hypothetical protein